MLNRKELTLLARVGALNNLGRIEHRRDALWQVERAGKLEGPLLRQRSELLQEGSKNRPLQQMSTEERLIAEVIDTVSIRERDVQDREGRWYSMRIRPYRTSDNKIDGAVILLVDIDRIRRGPAGADTPAGES